MSHKKRKVLNEPFNNSHIFYFRNLICFWLSTPWISTLFQLYAVPVRVCSTREDMHYLWVISSVPVSHILSTREGMQYPWVISSVPVRICSTRESYPQYQWGYAVPVSHILSTRENMQYPWGKFHSFFIHINLLTGTEDMTQVYCIPSWVLRIWLTGTKYPHGYWGYDSKVLMIWLTGTEDMTHGYWWYDSQVLMIWLTGTAYPHGYWGYDSRVLRIWLTGNAYSLHRVIRFWYIDISFSFTISQLISNRVLNQKLHLNIFKKGRKQGFSFRPNQRDMSTWNRYLFDYLAVFVLSQKPRQKEFFFLWVQRFVRR